MTGLNAGEDVPGWVVFTCRSPGAWRRPIRSPPTTTSRFSSVVRRKKCALSTPG